MKLVIETYVRVRGDVRIRGDFDRWIVNAHRMFHTVGNTCERKANILPKDTDWLVK